MRKIELPLAARNLDPARCWGHFVPPAGDLTPRARVLKAQQWSAMTDIPATTARKRHALSLFEGLPANYDRMGTLLSFGQDPRWRREMVRAVDPQAGQRVLDVATGTGLVAQELARRAPCEVVGVDQSEPMLAAARARLTQD